ncbi:MAG TPA: hypothetical protein PK156_44945 [Polyangium sp.]|nr:hypothetical protein [Polyangium sp.]
MKRREVRVVRALGLACTREVRETYGLGCWPARGKCGMPMGLGAGLHAGSAGCLWAWVLACTREVRDVYGLG